MKLCSLTIFAFVLGFIGWAANSQSKVNELCVAFSYAEFFVTEIDAKAYTMGPEDRKLLRFLEDKDMSRETRERLLNLRPGLTRESVKKNWSENGGLVPCQFLLLEKGCGPDFVAVRIEWRPATMPERVFQDRKTRAKWILKHAPMPAPNDIAMRISHPYLAKFVID